MSFSKYIQDKRILEALSNIGFKQPTTVQKKVIPQLLQRRNLIVEAATGTGKTAAYGIPILEQLNYQKRNTQALVLAPSRELAMQIYTAIKSYTTNPKLRIAVLTGGDSLESSGEMIKSGPHITIAVPGRLKDVLRTGKYDFFWKDIKFLIVDEVDKMLAMGFQGIVDNLVSNTRNNIQVALFSATIPPDIELLIRERFYPLQEIRLSPSEALKNIIFRAVQVPDGNRDKALLQLVTTKNIRQALIFCDKRDTITRLAHLFRENGLLAEAYHGLLDQEARAAIMEQFQKKQLRWLFATDLAARGIDVKGLPVVIHYDVPKDLETYLHRSGRTGRAGAKGVVYCLPANQKEMITLQQYHMAVHIGMKEIGLSKKMPSGSTSWQKIQLSKGKKDKIRKADVVGFLTGLEGVGAEDIGTIVLYDNYILVDLKTDVCGQIFEMQTGQRMKIKGRQVKVSKFTAAAQQRKEAAVKKRKFGVRDKSKVAKNNKKR